MPQPMKVDVLITRVARSTTKNGDPMWLLFTTGGDRLYVFDNQLDKEPWVNSGYRKWFEAMDEGEAQRWETNPIPLVLTRHGKYPSIQHVTRWSEERVPDKFNPPPGGAWQLHGDLWRMVLPRLTRAATVVFDTETTGVDTSTDEIVSVAATMYPNPHAIAAENMGINTRYYTLVKPNNPDKLLWQSAKGTCAYDIHGIHPDNLVGAPTFREIYEDLSAALHGKHWVCWNSDFDVNLLDSLCMRHHLPLIPRSTVWCAMKLLSPMAREWDYGRGQYKWAKLERMAKIAGLDFPDAHNAQADVDMTIKVLTWAAEQVANRMPY